MIQNFECTNIYTTDTARLAKFYIEQLGIPVQFEGFRNYDGVKLGFSRTSAGIVIWDESKWGRTGSNSVSFVFSCYNLDETYLELKAKGVEVEPPITAVWGGREMNFQDPDGNYISLLEQAY